MKHNNWFKLKYPTAEDALKNPKSQVAEQAAGRYIRTDHYSKCIYVYKKKELRKGNNIM